jgi:hypothetical protein
MGESVAGQHAIGRCKFSLKSGGVVRKILSFQRLAGVATESLPGAITHAEARRKSR